MAIHPDKLPPSITKDEIIRMSDMLSLYRRIAQNESAVNKQSLALRALLATVPSIEPQLMPVKKDSYYIPFLVAFTAMMGLIRIFMRFFNRTVSKVEVSRPVRVTSENKEVRKSVGAGPSTYLSSVTTRGRSYVPIGITNSHIAIIEKAPAQKNLNTILSKLNDLFSDLIIPEPVYWHNAADERFILGLADERYCFDTQGGGKTFWFSKSALSVLITNYCKFHLGVEEPFIRHSANHLALEQPAALRLKDNTRSIRRYHAALFKPLEQLAHLYYPMDIQLEYRQEKFSVTFNLNEKSLCEINPRSLTKRPFLRCVRRSLNLEGLDEQFSIPFETINRMSLPNEKDFAAMKKEACIVKGKELREQPGFFNQSANEARIDGSEVTRSRVSKKL